MEQSDAKNHFHEVLFMYFYVIHIKSCEKLRKREILFSFLIL